jgi:hypothetical protein
MQGRLVNPAGGETHMEEHTGVGPAPVNAHAETVVTTSGSADVAMDRTEVVAYDPFASRRWWTYKVIQLIYLVFGLIDALIAIRFILKALGANPEAGFARLVYGLTALFMAPFAGLLASVPSDLGVIELDAIVALMAYTLLAWLLAKLVWLLFGEPRRAMRTVASTVDTHVRH